MLLWNRYTEGIDLNVVDSCGVIVMSLCNEIIHACIEYIITVKMMILLIMMLIMIMIMMMIMMICSYRRMMMVRRVQHSTSNSIGIMGSIWINRD